MLVLSRRADETLVFPELGITVQVLRLSPHQVKLGIVAPPDIHVVRGEISGSRVALGEQAEPNQVAGQLQLHLLAAAEVLQRLHASLETRRWEEAEPLVFELFKELKRMNDQVAAIPRVRSAGPMRKRALIVDDNRNETRLLASYLRLKDFETETAENGAEAISFLSHHEIPDVVVLDMNMPKFDGRWTVNELRSNRRFDGLKIFAVSGIHPGEYGVQLGREGVDRWFRKPLNPDDLVHEILRGLEEGLAPVA